MLLTSDFIENHATQTVDPGNERALVMRGLKISLIENLGSTRDSYGCIDLSDNQITHVENIPKLRRLRTLIIANNSVSRISSDAFESLPELTSLVLSNNRISRLSTLLPLTNLRRLERLSLIHNPVCNIEHYRHFVIHLFEYSRSFRFLDFQRVTDAERQDAKAFFSTPAGIKLIRDIVPDHADMTQTRRGEAAQAKPAFSAEILDKLQIAIMEATDIDVVTKLEKALMSGELTSDVSKLIGLS
jgi:U2 small nuclear ribonucleoprotein A'